MDGAHALLLQNLHVPGRDGHAVGRSRGHVEDTGVQEPLRRGHAVAFDALPVLLLRLGQVNLHPRALLDVGAAAVGVGADDVGGGGVLCVHGEVDAHAAVLRAVVLLKQLDGLGDAEAVLHALVGVEALHHAADVHLHADALVGCDGGLGLHVHITEGGHARGDQLHHGQLVAGGDVLGGHAILHRDHLVEQPLLQRQVAAHAAQQGHAVVAVAVDQAGHQQAARHVAHVVVVFRRAIRIDVADRVAVHAQTAVLNIMEGIIFPGQNSGVHKQSLHSSTSPMRPMIFVT